MAVSRLRGRLPLVVFVLLVVVCLLLLGLAGAFPTGDQLALDAASALPAPADAWPAIVVSLLTAASLLGARRLAIRRSPALLQRFLL